MQTIREFWEENQVDGYAVAFDFYAGSNYLAVEELRDGKLAITDANCCSRESGPCDETLYIDEVTLEWLSCVIDDPQELEYLSKVFPNKD